MREFLYDLIIYSAACRKSSSEGAEKFCKRRQNFSTLVHVADRDECWKFSSDLTLFDDPIRVPNINEPGCICLIPFDITLKYVRMTIQNSGFFNNLFFHSPYYATRKSWAWEDEPVST